MAKTRLAGGAALLALVLFAVAGVAPGQEAPRQQLANGGMEEGPAGQPPPGWSFKSNCGATARLDTDQPFAGSQSVAVDASQATSKQPPFSNLLQSLDGKPWQGKRVRFRAAVKVGTLAAGASVQLWCRVDRPDQQIGAFDNMGDRAIKNTAWVQHDIVLDVEADAVRVVCGMFVIGKGSAWLDDVTLEVVDASVATTGGEVASQGRRTQLAPAVQKALDEAEKAPQQPFFTAWLLLPAFALIAFLVALWPLHRGPEPGAVRWFATRFTIAYWLLYCLPGPFSELIPWLGPRLAALRQWIDQGLAQWTAHTCFGIDGELVPPNGSGDTTFNYLTDLNGCVLAVLLASIWSFVGSRRFRHEALLDLLRSYLRYVLALAMLGYGLAKVTMVGNQFPVVGDWQVNKTWGSCSPMNVLWAFMGSSRPYTIFAGMGEVLAAVLLIWRRTGSLGAVVAVGVMTNVVMLNFCYDVPVKLYSSHLLLMAVLILVPDLRRWFDVLVLQRAVAAAASASVWRGARLRWVRVGIKAAVVVVGFAVPLGSVAIENYHHWAEPPAETGKDAASDDRPLLLRRGFRWINEVPYNR